MSEDSDPPSARTLTDHRESSHGYIRRRGRMTKAQTRGLNELLEQYSIAASQVSADSSRQGMEIGFGMGHGLLGWAHAEPDTRLLGVELYLPGVGALADALAKAKITNVQLITELAQHVIPALPDQCLDEIRILFPDPWPKKRHHKRRLIQREFVSMLPRVLKSGGRLWMATDWAPYAEWMRATLSEESAFEVLTDRIRPSEEAQIDVAEPLPELERVSTKFEQRGARLGHAIHDLIYTLVDKDTR